MMTGAFARSCTNSSVAAVALALWSGMMQGKCTEYWDRMEGCSTRWYLHRHRVAQQRHPRSEHIRNSRCNNGSIFPRRVLYTIEDLELCTVEICGASLGVRCKCGLMP
jgi:hypothetical protein